jgi:hypothetical protein
MIAPTRQRLIVMVPLWIIGVLASQAGAQLVDPAGDAVVRRTDQGNDGPISPAAVLPDLTRIVIQGWTMTTPGGDPFTGSPVGGPANLMRIDAQFAGMLNPPGPLGLSGQPYDPYRFGPSPLYGFIEIDVDNDADTGGQLTGAARLRLLGNVGRFGARAPGALAGRTAEYAGQRDNDYLSAPFFERSGEDFALSFCGCFTPSVEGGDNNGNGVFDPGEVWMVRGRFFPRAAGYAPASPVQGGSAMGQYDPRVLLRWSYSAVADTTTVSVVYPLTPAGAATMFNRPVQGIDILFDDTGANAYSLQEAVQDLITEAQGGYPGWGMPTGLTAILMQHWAGKVATDYLNPANYHVQGIVGTAYSSQDFDTGALYVWTDVAFGLPQGDLNGNGVADGVDAGLVTQYLAVTDGTNGDADGVVNGSVPVTDLGLNFLIYDVNGDGVVNGDDIDFYSAFCPADWDLNGVVNSTDVSLFLNDWFSDLINGGMKSDYDNNGVVNSTDVSSYVNAWFHDSIDCAQ